MDRIFRDVVFRALRRISRCCLELDTPEGHITFGDQSSVLRAHIVVHHPRFFRRVVLGGDVGAGESFVDGDWSSPDLVAVIRVAVRNLKYIGDPGGWVSSLARAVNRVIHGSRSNTISGSAANISRHYDLGNEFYNLFLDRSMTYSSGMFSTADTSLEEAQRLKYETVCRQLDLQPHDHVLEIGSGWGGFAAYAAQTRGCHVSTATVSRSQYDHVVSMIRSLGIESRVLPLMEDYRNLRGRYSKLVSIEMFEAVGFRHYDQYFAACDRLLDPGGRMFLQTITMNEPSFRTYIRSCDWTQKHIFPGGELASLVEIQKSMARSTSLEVRHIEDIGLHYPPTLRAWRDRFHASESAVRALGFDDRFVRMWVYYLSYCEGAFIERHISTCQMVLERK